MDPIEILSGRAVRGRVEVPPSKSATLRVAVLGLLGRRPLRVRNPLDSEDTRLMWAALESAGCRVDRGERETTIEPAPVLAATVPAATLPAPPVTIWCGDAGTNLRFLTGVLSALDGAWRLEGSPRLCERPLGPLLDALRQLGAEISCPEREGFAPLVISGGGLKGGTVSLDAGRSSQFLSALILAGLGAGAPIAIEALELTSAPYVDLTLDAVALFGGRVDVSGRLYRVRPELDPPAIVEVEGDFSSAAYFASAAVLSGGEVKLSGLRRDSSQGDRRFLDVMARMGAEVTWSGTGPRVRAGERLSAVDVDMGSMPDQVPTLAALAPFARGSTRIRNVPHLRLKESDRLAAMAQELSRLGVPVSERAAELVVEGVWAEATPPSTPVLVDSHGDHRIAMSMALTGLRRPGVRIGSPDVVAKSYPGFWTEWERLLRRG